MLLVRMLLSRQNAALGTDVFLKLDRLVFASTPPRNLQVMFIVTCLQEGSPIYILRKLLFLENVPERRPGRNRLYSILEPCHSKYILHHILETSPKDS